MKPVKKILVVGNRYSGKSEIWKRIGKDWNRVMVLNEDYSNYNRYQPMFNYYMNKKGFVYNPFAYGNQLLNLRNKLIREIDKKDPDWVYLVDSSLYEDRHIFSQILLERGVMSKDEHIDYKHLFEKTARNLPLPSAVVYLNVCSDLWSTRLAAKNKKSESWITSHFLEDIELHFKERLMERLTLLNPEIQILTVDINEEWKIEDTVKRVQTKMKEQLGYNFEMRSGIF